MPFLWSWIFILHLLVQPGGVISAENHTMDGIYVRVEGSEPLFSSKLLGVAPKPSRPNVGAIVAGAFAGLGLITAFIVWFFLFRKRKSVADIEDQKQRPDEGLKSEFSPDEKPRFDRIYDAFSRRGAKKSQKSILPIYQSSLPPVPINPIDRPTPAHIPRYPSVLERSYSSRPRPPPPLGSPQDLSRAASITESIRSAQPDYRASRRKVQVPPRALLVPTTGRSLLGFSDKGGKGSSRSPRSPSVRKSWLLKRPFKHPFIPLRDPDSSVHFPPGSPLHHAHYHPSKQLLESRVDSKSPKTPKTARREPPLIKRQPVPVYEEEDGAKTARLVEALHAERSRTPTTAQPAISKHPPSSSPAYI